MKASVIREMSSTEIRERIENEKSAYHKMKMNHVVSNLENPIKLKFARKAIARLSTELTKREVDEANGITEVASIPTKKKADPAKEKDTKTTEEVKDVVVAGTTETTKVVIEDPKSTTKE